MSSRIGHGVDTHRLVPGRQLILGGVEIPWDKGLLGHSDADVVCHALSNALLGAIGEGDNHQARQDFRGVRRSCDRQNPLRDRRRLPGTS